VSGLLDLSILLELTFLTLVLLRELSVEVHSLDLMIFERESLILVLLLDVSILCSIVLMDVTLVTHELWLLLKITFKLEFNGQVSS